MVRRSRNKRSRRKKRTGDSRDRRKGGDVGAFFLMIFLIWLLVGRNNDVSLDPTYEAQLSRLNETKQNLESLIRFIDQQTITINEREALLSKMAAENESLAIALEANREEFDAWADALESRRQRDIWIERSIAFAIGFLASYLAAAARRALRRKKASGGDT